MTLEPQELSGDRAAAHGDFVFLGKACRHKELGEAFAGRLGGLRAVLPAGDHRHHLLADLYDPIGWNAAVMRGSQQKPAAFGNIERARGLACSGRGGAEHQGGRPGHRD
jgi:hypothetical protein